MDMGKYQVTHTGNNAISKNNHFLLYGIHRHHCKAYEPTAVLDFGYYRISEQRMLRQACANAQAFQSIRCLHIQSVDES